MVDAETVNVRYLVDDVAECIIGQLHRAVPVGRRLVSRQFG